METVLRTTGLTKRFKEKVAVNKVNMTIEKGEIYGFIGKNGAGKTTMMKLILGLCFADEGKIELFDGQHLDKMRRRIGSLIEAPGLYKNCTAYENMKRFSLLSGGTDKEIKEYLYLVGLGNTGNKRAGEFSLGMKQRLGIAIALLGKPEFLVLDEPINGLDPEGIKEIRDIILMLHREGVTFLISSHLLDELAKIVTRYGIICDGSMIEEITVTELERRCQSGLKIVVNDAPKTISVLEGHIRREDMDISGKNTIFLRMNAEYAGKINSMLVKSGIEVRELSVQHGGFENYFIERIGR